MRIENSFLPVSGVGEQTERDLWRAGITTWEAFDGSVVGPTTAERIAAFIETARTRLDRGDAGFFGDAFPSTEHWRCYENFRSGACFLDIETTGLHRQHDAVTVVGMRRDGETTTLVRGRDLDREALLAELREAKLLVTFNGKRFDVPFLEEAFGIDIDLPHVDLLYSCRRLDLTGGLKAVERSLGLDRDRPDLSGEDAVRLWREYERGDRAALETLVSYNREDVRNLEPLVETVTRRLHERVFEGEADRG